MNPPALPPVHLVDPHAPLRRKLRRLLEGAGHTAEEFGSAEAYLHRPATPSGACVVLEARLPGISGIELQQILTAGGRTDQMVFMTSRKDISLCASVMKAGAVDFLPKPFPPVALLEAVRTAQTRIFHAEKTKAAFARARARLDRLTLREMEVFRLLIAGLLNKEIGAELGTAEKTVKIQRASIISKLRLPSVADMVWLAQQAGVQPLPRRHADQAARQEIPSSHAVPGSGLFCD